MYKNNTKKILVCLPVYNEARLLKRAVNSILEQTYNNFSLVIVNDGSTDNSLEEANKFLYDSRVTVVDNKKNSGCFYSKNVGIKFMESGNFDIYTTHDADDFSQPTRFEEIVNVFESNPNIVSVQDFEFRIGNNPPNWYNPPFTSMINLAHAFFNKEIFDNLGYYDNIGYSGDEEYWNRINAYCNLNNKINSTLNKILYYAEITDDNMILRYGDELREVYRKKFKPEIEKMKLTNNFYRDFFNQKEIKVHA
jgi:glycosyltransferase involved in cell wall biosynthesis